MDAALDALVAAGRASSPWPALGIIVAAVQMSRWTHLEPHERAALRLDRHGRRRLPPRAARHRRPRRAGDHRRVLDRHDPLEPHGRAAPAAGAVGQARRVRRRDLRADARRGVRVVLRGRRRSSTSTTCSTTLGDPHALRAVIGTALFLTVLGAARASGSARSCATPPAASRRFVGLLFVLPGITALLPSSSPTSINPYLPLQRRLHGRDEHVRGPASPRAVDRASRVFCGYAALRRRGRGRAARAPRRLTRRRRVAGGTATGREHEPGPRRPSRAAGRAHRLLDVAVVAGVVADRLPGAAPHAVTATPDGLAVRRRAGAAAARGVAGTRSASSR